MRDHSKHIELTREEAVNRILAASGFMDEARELPVEMVALGEGFGRVLAEDAVSQSDVPSCLTCLMDSIAVHWDAFEAAGEDTLPDTSDWVRGVDWEFANTGVAMPEGFDTAVVVEHVEISEDEQHVKVNAAPSKRFAGTQPAGSRHKRGDVLACAGQTLTPDLAARIASGNNATVLVVRKPRVAFVPTGNELVPPGAPMDEFHGRRPAGYGRTFESNSILVRGKAEAWGAVFAPFDIVPDSRDAIREALARAVRCADIVVLNAGSSKGSDDWSCEVMEEMGEIICHETNHGPGHHSSFALIEGTPVVGISGPPAGATFTLDFYLRPLVRAYLGLDPIVPKTAARLVADFADKSGLGHKHGGAHHAHGGSKPVGEKRPRENKKAFFSIKLIKAEYGADGVLEATPIPGKPGGPGTEEANAFCMLSSVDGNTPPVAGDVIEIEFR